MALSTCRPTCTSTCYILILILSSPCFGGDATPWLELPDKISNFASSTVREEKDLLEDEEESPPNFSAGLNLALHGKQNNSGN